MFLRVHVYFVKGGCFFISATDIPFKYVGFSITPAKRKQSLALNQSPFAHIAKHIPMRQIELEEFSIIE
jgi:hypothetical protein